ncbi:MAG: ABC transporter ATP-binding protein [Rhodospirillales bacterium]|jgi:multiple sugar transport system ATP-binding protein
MAGISIESVRKSFGSMTALKELSLNIEDGEFVALLGPSGCGKTTLLRIVAGLETRSAGRILVGGRDVSDLPPRERKLAMVFQNYAVFPHMTVYENIAFGLRMAKADRTKVDRQVQRAAGLMHIEHLLARHPGQLSGGQRQRVAVARALAVEPSVLLMDEPLSNLDALLRMEMRAELKAVLREAGTTTLYVTHDQTEAMGLADRIAVMHDGRIEQLAPPMAVYRTPATVFVGSFVGAPPMNFLRCQAIDGTVAIGALKLACPRTSGEIVMGVRAEDLLPATADTGLPFEVRVVEPLGAHALLTGNAHGQQVRVVYAGERDVAAGETLHLAPIAGRICWMDAADGRAIEGRT